MGANPRIVAVETWIQWDGVSQRLPRGQVLDVVPGSALERAIGADRLVPLGGVAAQPAVEPAEPVKPAEKTAPEPKDAPVKPKAAAKDAGDGKDGAE